ncbi:MAG: pimeloyl-ACP methyl ester carboxylesterase [Crocinitomicaceae bacterium]|jgi:pimeloyl-ACP methyl ester carboxylesterase
MSQSARLSYQISGKGTPVLFLHGFLESSTMWDVLKMPSGIQAIKVDLPGHGKSTNSELLCDTMEEMAQKVSELMDDLGAVELDIIGHSMGGYVAMELKKNDRRIRNVLLLNSNFWEDNEAKIEDRYRIAELAERSLALFIYTVIPSLFLDPEKHDTEVKKLINESLKITPQAMGKASIAMSKRLNHASLIGQFPMDFTLIQGSLDSIVMINEMKARLTGLEVKLIELAGVGHMAHIELTTEVERQLGIFLENK